MYPTIYAFASYNGDVYSATLFASLPISEEDLLKLNDKVNIVVTAFNMDCGDIDIYEVDDKCVCYHIDKKCPVDLAIIRDIESGELRAKNMIDFLGIDKFTQKGTYNIVK